MDLLDEETFESDGWCDATIYSTKNSAFITGVTKEGKVMSTETDKFADCQNWTDIVDVDITYQGEKMYGVKSDGTVIFVG